MWKYVSYWVGGVRWVRHARALETHPPSLHGAVRAAIATLAIDIQ